VKRRELRLQGAGLAAETDDLDLVVNRAQERFRGELGFEEEVVRAEFQKMDRRVLAGETGDDDATNVGQGFFDFGEHLVAALARHADVGEQHVKMFLLAKRDRLGAVVHRTHGVVGELFDDAFVFDQVLALVVHKQNFDVAGHKNLSRLGHSRQRRHIGNSSLACRANETQLGDCFNRRQRSAPQTSAPARH
jgi:hypothetical protein